MVVPRHKDTEGTYQALTSELRMEKLSCPSLSLNHFLLTASESAHSNQLKEDIHKSMLLKYFRQQDNPTFHLPTIPVLVHGVRRQASDSEVGNVVYVVKRLTVKLH